MSRTIIIDADVIGQINRGNASAARALQSAIKRGDAVFISQQAYNELVVDPDLPRTASANREILKDLRITVASSGTFQDRAATYSNNDRTLSLKDSLTAAQAKAINAEVWSFDKAYRLNGKGVEKTLGVKVAPETYEVQTLNDQQIKMPREDYRVARQLMNLPPVEITVGGRVMRIGPSGAPPSQTGKTVEEAAEVSATVGEGMPIGFDGVNKTAQAGFGGAILILELLNTLLTRLNDAKQEDLIKKEVARLQPALNQARFSDPANGVLLAIYFNQSVASADSILQPGAQFTHIEMGVGYSRDEAREDLYRRPVLREVSSVNLRVFTQEFWIAPTAPSSVASLRTPFPHVALGTFSETGRQLQNVEWAGIMGFDDQDECELTGGGFASFVLLRPPGEIRWFDGNIFTDSSIPLVLRKSSDGTVLDALNLDPWVPGSVSVVPVFPFDSATDRLFGQGSSTRDDGRQLRLYCNIEKLRWVRPEKIRVTKK